MLLPILKRIRNAIRQTLNRVRERCRMWIFGTDEWHSYIQWNTIRHEYKLFQIKKADSGRLVVYMTENTEFAGLADRLKTFVNSYIIANENNRQLYICHTKGFPLEKYLEPNEVNWLISPCEISRGLNRVAFLWFTHDCPVLLHKEREYHAYALFDSILPTLPESKQAQYGFDRVFHKLFKPTTHLEGLVEKAMRSVGLEENQFIAFHLRFLDFFEPVEMNRTEADVTGTPEQQEQMIADVHATIDQVYRTSACKHVLLFSDSNKFLQSPHPDYIKVLPGTVGHIARHNDAGSITDKAFTDLLVMSKAAQVYSITGPNIYGGAFSRTAAAIGGKELIEVPYIRSNN